MKIRFWGVRGSIPTPGPRTVRYGGNTTCIEIRTDNNALIILDAGTGLFVMAQELLKQLPIRANIFLTHTHWDHIQGLPFFIPIFIPNNQIRIHGTFDPVSQRNIQEVLSRQMEYCYFPVREAELKADISYRTLREGEVTQIEDATISTIFMNHPVLNFGYKITCQGKSVFFTGDHEDPYNIYDPSDEGFALYEKLIVQRRQMILDFIQGVDVLIVDSAYTTEQYLALKRGWGHGTFDSAVALAKQAQVKTLFLTHHEPFRSDDELDKIYQDLLVRYPRQPGDPQYLFAREGLEFTV